MVPCVADALTIVAVVIASCDCCFAVAVTMAFATVVDFAAVAVA